MRHMKIDDFHAMRVNLHCMKISKFHAKSCVHESWRFLCTKLELVSLHKNRHGIAQAFLKSTLSDALAVSGWLGESDVC